MLSAIAGRPAPRVGSGPPCRVATKATTIAAADSSIKTTRDQLRPKKVARPSAMSTAPTTVSAIAVVAGALVSMCVGSTLSASGTRATTNAATRETNPRRQATVAPNVVGAGRLSRLSVVDDATGIAGASIGRRSTTG